MSGRGTSAGVLFQSEVGAYAAALLLTERPLSRLGDNLPGKPLKIFMESPSAVDDVNVVTDRGFVYFQAKTSLSLSDNPASELGSVFDQFVRQYLQGVPNGSKTREMDLSRDRLVLVISENAPATVRNDLREALSRNRTGAAALKIFTAIGQQFYFAIGHREGVSLSMEQQRIFLREYAPLISKLTTLGSPKTVHDCLQVLERFIAADPEQCFELISEAMLRTSGVEKYKYEPMGAKLFVKLVEIFLADYRYIFADPTRRKQLIDCLAVFVDAGWPEARRLFQQLPDLR